MSHLSTHNDLPQPAPARAKRAVSRRGRGLQSHLSDNITPIYALLVIFYALWVVGGLLQTDFSRNGKLTSPHSHDSGLAEVSEIEAESKVEAELFTLSPSWVMPSFEITATPVVNDRQPVVAIRLCTASLLRGPPAA